jgi:hypothetical protein
MTIRRYRIKNMDFKTRDDLLQANSVIIAQLQSRLNVKRYRVNEADSSKLAHVNALVGSLKVQNEILQACDLDEIKEELNSLKKSKTVI